jgi:hypothetical protein
MELPFFQTCNTVPNTGNTLSSLSLRVKNTTVQKTMTLTSPLLQVIAASAVSCFFSSTILVTAATFKFLRKRLFFRMLVYIALSDTLANAGTLFPPPEQGSSLCVFQGILQTYFYTCSFLWSALFAYVLHGMAIYKRVLISEPVMFLIGFGYPLVTTLLPLATIKISYARDDDAVYQSCIITNGPAQGVLAAQLFQYLLPLWISFLVIIACGIRVSFCAKDLSNSSHTYVLTTQSLALYPLALIICWLPISIINMLELPGLNVSFPSNNPNLNIPNVLAILHGSLTTLIFFWKSPHVRMAWFRLVFTNSGDDIGNRPEDDKGVIDNIEMSMSGQSRSYNTQPKVSDIEGYRQSDFDLSVGDRDSTASFAVEGSIFGAQGRQFILMNVRASAFWRGSLASNSSQHSHAQERSSDNTSAASSVASSSSATATPTTSSLHL